MSGLPLDTYRELEGQIDGAEGTGIMARWHFGQNLLAERRANGGKQLPKGRLDELAEAFGKSRQELGFRMMFAERFHEDEVSNAVRNFGSWHNVIAQALSSTAHLSSEKDEWATPQDLFDELDSKFKFTLDVCASEANHKCEDYFSETDNALDREWSGVCWMNPPYSGIDEWMAKAWQESQVGVTVVCLVPSRTDVGWFWDLARHGEIRFLRGRLHFVDDEGNTGPAPFPSCLVIFGGEPSLGWHERP